MAGSAGKASASAVQASLLELLEEQQREAELWLEQHHLALREAVQRTLAGAASTAAPGTAAEATTRPAAPKAANADAGPAPGPAQPRAADQGPEVGSAGKSAPAAGAVAGEPAAGKESPNDGEGNLDNDSAASGNREASDGPTPARAASNTTSTFIQKLTSREDEDILQSGPLSHRTYMSVKDGTFFEFFMAFLIITNTVIIFVQLEMEGQTNDPLNDVSSEEPHLAAATFEGFKNFFTLLFLVELLLKLYFQRGKYLTRAFNLFDFMVVMITTVDMLILPQRSLNVSYLRTIRMLRLAHVLRVIRIMDIFRQLRVLMKPFILSFTSIVWSMLILFIFMLVSSLLVCQLLQETIADFNADDEIRVFSQKYYGTSTRALYTFFEVTFSGCWPNYARPLIELHHPAWAIFWLSYVTLIVFTLIRIIYALILKDTMQAAANDADHLVLERTAQTKSTLTRLEELFNAADRSGDGRISKEAFEEILKYPKVKTWLQTLGVQPHDCDSLFDLLDDSGDHLLDYKEFTDGIMRLKGTANQQQLLTTGRDTRRILKHCEALRKDVAVLFEAG